MTTRTLIRRARKEHRCSETSYHRIMPGQQYLYAEAAPWHDMNSGQKWSIIRACLRCAEQYGLHNSDTRRQLAESGSKS